MKSRYYLRIVILLLVSLLVFSAVHYCNVWIARNIDNPSIKWTILFANYVIIYLFGSITQILLSGSFHTIKWFAIDKPILTVLSLSMFVANFMASVYYVDIISGIGVSDHFIYSLLDDENKVLLNMLAGFMLATSLGGNSKVKSSC